MDKPPLAGIKVADFTWVWAGPYCTLQLAHLGADVVRVESKTRICVTRLLPPWPEMKPGGVNRSGYFNQFNQGKRSITLNRKAPQAIEVAERLVKWSDVVVSNFAAGVMDRLGLGYERLRQLKPDLIVASLTGYGESGPLKDYVAYGPAQVPLSGLSSLTGYAGWPPMHVGLSYADPNAGAHAAFAILAALWHREKTGEGQYIEMSQWECAIQTVAEGLMEYQMTGKAPERSGSRDRSMVPHGVFPAKSELVLMGMQIDAWVTITVADDAQWASLAQVIGRPELAADPRFATVQARRQREDEIEGMVAEWTSQRRAAEAAAALQEAGVAAAVCANVKDLSEDPHLTERGYLVELDHAEVGRRKHAGIPWRMGATPCAVRSPAPLLGEHSDEVLRAVLGYSAEEVAALRAQGALE